MPLPQGTRLGPYEVDLPLGGGGQGDVYAARDTRLGRDVAIKVLSEHYSHSAEDLERFHREARTLAALNHPHICALYDIGREGDTDFLVMERVEGETLAHRLSRGRLPIAEVLKIGAQIADALDRAHRAGVVHRDLKPGNVMWTRSGVKVMDFGLASALRFARPDDSTITALPHLQGSVTKTGGIPGTVPYMAPEQLEGKRADGRTDIWALGCVLYEMLTSRRAFDGDTHAALVSAIMRGEPPTISMARSDVPPALERLVGQCLAKDPDDRWQTSGDLRRELSWIAEAGSTTGTPPTLDLSRRRRERFAWIAAAIITTVAVTLVVVSLRPKPAPKPVVFEIPPPPHARIAKEAGIYGLDVPRISPNGRILACNLGDSLGHRSIWLRYMDSREVKELPGTDGAKRMFWSPDSRYLAYFAGGRLYRVDVTGGSPTVVCDAPNGDLGTWGSRDIIVFDWAEGDSIQSVPASGGVPRGVPLVDRLSGERVAWPEFLPDGRHFLYLSTYDVNRDRSTLRVGSIDSRESRELGDVGSGVVYACGHVLYVQDGVLLAREFDARSLRFVGDPLPIVENIGAVEMAFQLWKFSASHEGTLVYQSAGSGATDRLVWLDRSGRETGRVGGPDQYRAPDLSPDGKQLAVLVGIPDETQDVWIWDLARNVESRFTFTNGQVETPVWSPDGSRLAFVSNSDTTWEVHVKPASVAGTDSVVYKSDHITLLDDWSPDGRDIAYIRILEAGVISADIYALPVGGTGSPTPLVASEMADGQARFSPDGRWLAYTSLESRALEVYVRALDGSGRTWRVSTGSGSDPQWRGDSRELYYISDHLKLMAVRLGGATPRFSQPQELFTAPVMHNPFAARNRYDVSADGQRFLVVSIDQGAPAPTTVVLNWPARLGSR